VSNRDDDSLQSKVESWATVARQHEIELESTRIQLWDRQSESESWANVAREAQVAASFDVLVPIYNKRKGQELLATVLLESDTSDKPLSIIACDIDFFKQVNDEHGHQIGDQVLIEVAKILDKKFIAYRNGGEEFIIICQDTTSTHACEHAESLRRSIESAKISGISITCSFGVAQHRQGMSIDKLIKHADDALYNAKNSGRNKVVIFE